MQLGKEVSEKLTEQGAFDLIQQVKAELRCRVMFPLEEQHVILTASRWQNQYLQKLARLGGNVYYLSIIRNSRND